MGTDARQEQQGRPTAPGGREQGELAFDPGARLPEEGETAGEGVEKEVLEVDPDDDGQILEPFDPARISIVTREPSLDLVMQRVDRGEIELRPDFQRSDDIWPPRDQSRLIESLLLRIPLPVFYVAADRDDNWRVVDGLQRLTALSRFIVHGELRLKGLEYLHQFEGKSYAGLPRPMQRRINETQLSFHVIEPGTPPEVMYNVFKRINTVGKPLAGQEIRHALNPGPARDLLRSLSESDEFLAATDGTVRARRMADRECVLRFLAFRSLGLDAYNGKLDDFLMRAMRFLNQRPELYESLAADFLRAMSLGATLFGKEAFRKPTRPGYSGGRSPVNKPLFESLAVALARVPRDGRHRLLERRDGIMSGLASLMEDPVFMESISVGTQTTKQVRTRFGETRALIERALS